MQFPLIRIFEQASWDHKAAELVHAQVYKVLRRRGHCNVVLTGGGSARRMYAAWSRVFDISLLKNVSFYFGDERCVPPDHLESNFRMAVDHLFGDGIPRDVLFIALRPRVLTLKRRHVVTQQSYRNLLIFCCLAWVRTVTLPHYFLTLWHCTKRDGSCCRSSGLNSRTND